MTEIVIGNRAVGRGHPPWIVAELSGNHNQSLERALEMVEAAAAAGVHAVKLQTYTADTMTLDLREREFVVDDPNSLWHGESLYELYRKAHTPWEWHEEIFERCRRLGLAAFSTPFDATAVDFLEGLGVPCYKVASFENTDLALIRKIAATGKPILLSTGMTTTADLDTSVRTARQAGCRALVLLKCTSTYPASPEDSHVRTIPHMRELFGCEVGLSDHTLGIGVPVAAVALGAVVIEKHFTLARSDGGVDAAFSLEAGEFRALVEETERAWRALGEVRYGPTGPERGSRVFRRSLYVVRDLEAGEALDEHSVRAIRPGYGLPPRYLDVVLGLRVTRPVKKGTALTWDLVR